MVRVLGLVVVVVGVALLVWCMYIQPPSPEPAGAGQVAGAAAHVSAGSPVVAPSGEVASAPPPRPGLDPELPIDPSRPMPKDSLSTDGTLERDRPARFLVEGRSDIYSAGLAAPDPDRQGVLPAKITLAAGAGVIRFPRVAGKAGCVQEAAYGPDGGDCVGGDTNLEPAGGISGVVAHERSLFLAGVFLATRAPAVPPPALDFSAAARGVAFPELAPVLGQVFFIGDGLTGTGSGETQRFVVPAGATHLYLGYADGAGFQGAPGWYGDNTGGLDATVVQRAD